MPGKPTIPEVLPLVITYYSIRGNEVGGSLHAVLDDGNVADHNVAFAINYASQYHDSRGVQLGWILLGMSKTQRLKLGYMAHADLMCTRPAVEFDRRYFLFLAKHPDLAVPADPAECQQAHSE